MTTIEINNIRNEKGIFQASNEVANWNALSRDGFHIITINGKMKKYTESGFAKRLTQLLNRGF